MSEEEAEMAWRMQEYFLAQERVLHERKGGG